MIFFSELYFSPVDPVFISPLLKLGFFNVSFPRNADILHPPWGGGGGGGAEVQLAPFFLEFRFSCEVRWSFLLSIFLARTKPNFVWE